MKSTIIKKASARIFRAPLNQPFRTAKGQHDRLENILFKIELEEGTVGFGEAAIATHITGETVSQTLKNIKAVGKSLIGRDAADYPRISKGLNEVLPLNRSAIAALEVGLMDALTRQWKIPLWKFFGPKAGLLTTDITIVIADLNETEDAVKRYYQQGFRTFKVKIGRDEYRDLKRVQIVAGIAKNCPIYLDANQGFNAQQTLRFLKNLKRFQIHPALIEQPVNKYDFEGLVKVNRSTKVPVCADESASTLEDVKRIIRYKAAGVINIKLMKSGMFQAREIALLSKKHRLKLMIGGMMESPLAMTAAAHLAVGLGGFDYVDLDTPFFIKKGIFSHPHLSQKGTYDLRKIKAGIGVMIP